MPEHFIYPKHDFLYTFLNDALLHRTRIITCSSLQLKQQINASFLTFYNNSDIV